MGGLPIHYNSGKQQNGYQNKNCRHEDTLKLFGKILCR